MRLSVDPASGRVRLTIPKRGSARAALAWAEEKRGWIDAQRARLPAAIPFVDGAELPFGDERLTIVWREAARRIPVLEDRALVVGGPADRLGARVESWLKREALRLLDADTHAIAAAAGIAISGVAIGDPRSRWGSCTATGAIRYSWRLVLAPGFVRRGVVAHEVAHRLHMDHSPAFHAAVARLLGEDPAPSMAWLRRHGAGLHWYGRSSS
ncbi:M48 family metallopeptidase [Sphingomonas qomolangmaensis]|uniref:M48 family metallopeptidase n=1 Tax=Sphingomonas qomolangmaensis TaxID=2918765 RepID=A0ABY5LHS0_9SPHN|nr:YgjP-like metallopeptidase domain-containing protein [Sphingomonas qomolangmaensis]UUL84286.1 M48 family metallopeptidase [Sphingomonas qomolangmaensis]